MAPPWFKMKLRAAVSERRAQGVRIEEICYRVGVSRSIMYAWMDGSASPRLRQFESLCSYMGWMERPFEWDGPLEELQTA